MKPPYYLVLEVRRGQHYYLSMRVSIVASCLIYLLLHAKQPLALEKDKTAWTPAYLTQGIQTPPKPIHTSNLSTPFPSVSIMTSEAGRRDLLKNKPQSSVPASTLVNPTELSVSVLIYALMALWLILGWMYCLGLPCKLTWISDSWTSWVPGSRKNRQVQQKPELEEGEDRMSKCQEHKW